MAMTSLRDLFGVSLLSFREVGRLEVGTESAVDRAKSIKSFLMSFFEADANYNVEGADTMNACYGGTNSLFSTVSWAQHDNRGQRFGVVICSDSAVHPSVRDLASIGASSIAMLIAAHACLILQVPRATFIKHSWDFYRPIGWPTNDAIVDIEVATC
jgi:hydroxymethylglutaryl-CoA synthase